MKEGRDEALAFALNHNSGVLSTVSPEGNPRSRFLYYACDDEFNIYFLTLANTRKAADIAANPHAAFVVSEIDAPRTLQIEGTVEDLTETATASPLLSQFMQFLTSGKRYGIPLERFDQTTMKWYRLKPDWIRWGNFTFGRGSEEVFAEIAAADASESN